MLNGIAARFYKDAYEAGGITAEEYLRCNWELALDLIASRQEREAPDMRYDEHVWTWRRYLWDTYPPTLFSMQIETKR